MLTLTPLPKAEPVTFPLGYNVEIEGYDTEIATTWHNADKIVGYYANRGVLATIHPFY